MIVPRNPRAQGSRMLIAPAAPCGRKNHTSVVTTGPTGATRLSPRNGFNGFLRALPGEPGCLATLAYRPASPIDKLGSSIGEPGPHDFAVHESCDRLAPPSRPSHPVPRK